MFFFFFFFFFKFLIKIKEATKFFFFFFFFFLMAVPLRPYSPLPRASWPALCPLLMAIHLFCGFPNNVSNKNGSKLYVLQ